MSMKSILLRKTLLLPVIFAAIYTLSSCGERQAATDNTSVNKLDASFVRNPYTAEGVQSDVVDLLPTMDFQDDTFYNFGTLHEGESATHTFHFVNKGKTPLLITNAAGSCGCTVPDYPREPVPPGATAQINVKFNSAGKVGHQKKTVNIFANSNKGTHYITIEADVVE